MSLNTLFMKVYDIFNLDDIYIFSSLKLEKQLQKIKIYIILINRKSEEKE